MHSPLLSTTTSKLDLLVFDLLVIPPQPSELCNQNMPLARATLVQLADGATLLALTMSHMLGDQKSAALFMSAWAASSRGGTAGKPGIFGR